MKLFGYTVSKEAGEKEWGFTGASLPRYQKGGSTGVLICHGFGGTPANMRCLYERAVSMGFSVVMPLLTGHASTLAKMEQSGLADWRRDVDAALDKLLEMGCEKIFLCGLSMGALLMADLAERSAGHELIDGLMMICPPIKMKRYLRVSSLLAPVIPYVLTADSFDDDPDKEMYYGMASSKLAEIEKLSACVMHHTGGISCPVMMVEAEKDNRVDPVSYTQLAEHLPAARHEVISGAPHGIPYSDKANELCDLFESWFGELDKE